MYVSVRGEFPIRQDINVIPASVPLGWTDEHKVSKTIIRMRRAKGKTPDSLRMGWTIYEEVGICAINHYAISAIFFGTRQKYSSTTERINKMREYRENIIYATINTQGDECA